MYQQRRIVMSHHNLYSKDELLDHSPKVSKVGRLYRKFRGQRPPSTTASSSLAWHDATTASTSQLNLAPRHSSQFQPHTPQAISRANALRASRSHESLYTYATHAVDLEESTTRPVHASMMPPGADNCIHLRHERHDKFYRMDTPQQQQRWQHAMRQAVSPSRDAYKRVENSLHVSIVEVKRLPAKRRYYCELAVDQTLYAKTSAKAFDKDMCFWGESFDFPDVPPVHSIAVNVYREGSKKKAATLVGYVSLAVASVSGRQPLEKWYPIVTGEKVKGNPPSIRLKAKYQSVAVLPLECYKTFLEVALSDILQVCLALEQRISARQKEDLACVLVRIAHSRGTAASFLCSLVMAEVHTLEDDRLMFRGNSLATKAMESYQKLLAHHYLQYALKEFVRHIVDANRDCEVDPLKVSSVASLTANQRELMSNVECAWGKIVSSLAVFPPELRHVFSLLRQRLEEIGRPELVDTLTSASIFLRFVCPAVLSPSLFGLMDEYPPPPAARTLTLITKSLQTLANNSRFGGKEAYMHFMNAFVQRQAPAMVEFLRGISLQTPSAHTASSMETSIDLGKEAALLHTYLSEALPALPSTMQHEFAEVKDCLDDLDDYHEMEEGEVHAKLARSTMPPAIVGHHVVHSTSSYENTASTPSNEGNACYAVVASIDEPPVALKPRRPLARADVSAGDAVNGIVSLEFVDKSVERDDAKKGASSGYQSSQSPPSSSSASPTNRNGEEHTMSSTTTGHGSDGEREALYATVPPLTTETVPPLTTETVLDAREPVLLPVVPSHVIRARPFFVDHASLKSTVSSTSSNGSACSRPRRPRTNPKYGVEFTRATSLSLTPNHTRSDESAEEGTSTTASDWSHMQPFMDRLRRLEIELEAEKETNRTIVSQQQRQIDALRHDNEALKEVGMTQSLYAIADTPRMTSEFDERMTSSSKRPNDGRMPTNAMMMSHRYPDHLAHRINGSALMLDTSDL